MQIGLVEAESREIVNLIDSYSSAEKFISWIADEKYEKKTIQNHLSENIYSRIVQYYVNQILVFTEKSELFLDRMNNENAKQLTAIASSRQLVSFAELKTDKKHISKVLADPYYNIVSYVYEKDEVCGISWEIYELLRLVKVYKGKADPLRYWRTR